MSQRSSGIELGVAPPDVAIPARWTRLALISPVWEVPGRGKAFVDLQNDVTCEDVRLAAREGYEHVEHMKRYTTHGMATDQGRIGGLVGSAVLAQARGLSVAEVGQAKPRPFLQPVPFAALAGAEVGAHFKPKRRLPLHDWHEAAGATFANIGLWLRPLVYSQQSGLGAGAQGGARGAHARSALPMCRRWARSTCKDRDAAKFLDFVYANTFSTLADRRCALRHHAARGRHAARRWHHLEARERSTS